MLHVLADFVFSLKVVHSRVICCEDSCGSNDSFLSISLQCCTFWSTHAVHVCQFVLYYLHDAYPFGYVQCILGYDQNQIRIQYLDDADCPLYAREFALLVGWFLYKVNTCHSRWREPYSGTVLIDTSEEKVCHYSAYC